MNVPTVAITGVPDPLPEALAVLDVREPVEWAYGHIEGALHIPMSELPGRLDELPDAQTLVVCKVGGRSARVAVWLVAAGPRRGQPRRRPARLGGGRPRHGERDRPAAAGRLGRLGLRSTRTLVSPPRSGQLLAM